MLKPLKYFVLRRWKMLMVLFIVVITIVFFARSAQRKAQWLDCQGHLAWIRHGMFWYYSRHDCFPPAYVDAPDGSRMHSWRILVAKEAESSDWPPVPYDYHEPWSSPNNSKLAVYRPVALACPSDPDTQGNKRLTNYFVIEGANTPFPESGTRSFADSEKSSEDRSNTILVAEATGLSIEWLEPRDLNYDTMSLKLNDLQLPSISSHHPNGCNALMADASVRTLSPAISPEVLKSMLNIRGSDWRPGPEKPDIP